MYRINRIFHVSGMLVLVFIAGLFPAIANPVTNSSYVNGADTVPEKSKNSLLAKRIFPLLYEIDNSKRIKRLLAGDKVLQGISQGWDQRINTAIKQCNDVKCLADALKLTDDEIRRAGDRMIVLSQRSDKLIDAVKASDAYSNEYNASDTVWIRNSWEHAAGGRNRIFDVYLAGKKPRYAAIDSISFNTSDPEFFRLVKQELSTVISRKHSRLHIIYELPLACALKTLIINGRDEAIRYEPLTAGINAAAFAAAQRTDWSRYQYAAMLVPGFGPDEPNVRIGQRGIERCKMGAARFKTGIVPFLVVSGGHVYPFRTPFCEAVEMKRYLVEELGVPAEAIIVEPYARHTTTNVRNTARIIYRFNMPVEKPVLVVTDPAQTEMIMNLAERCKRELGYVPFRDVKKLSEEESTFYPVKEAFQADMNDPLDP